ncbi:putative epoxide hydrolase [Diaporthe sp. PMI_573]|nr:putative epoxide hydrolase [Diaporthaceae sp. PMI_573]
MFNYIPIISSLSLLLAASSGAATSPNSIGSSGLYFNFPKTTTPKHFYIHVDQGLIELAQRKACDFRPSPSIHSGWTIEGPPEDAIAELAKYWANEYDWRTVEKRMNRDFKHYATTVPGNRNYSAPIPIHFVHERSTNDKAIPLLLVHGWGSSHLEWAKVMKPLAKGSERQAFHIVAPDLPGFGFSPSPSLAGLGPREIGLAFDAMMKRFGYTTYAIATTDIGWPVGMWMTADAHDSIFTHFTDFFLSVPEPSDLSRHANNETNPEETDFIAATDEWYAKHAAYATVQVQKPQALAAAMTDSPVGLAAWLWDLKQGSSDGYSYSYDELITDTMLTWIQQPYGAMRTYMEISQPDNFAYPKTDIPTGVTQWGNLNGPYKELAKFPLVPRTWVERRANITYFMRHDTGGHWPALAQPEEWVANVQAFFAGLEHGKSRE